MTRVIFVEGCHATTTTSSAVALANALHTYGVDAVAWHHPAHPAGAFGADRVAHYAEARRALRGPGPAVWVCDRGPWSGVAYARSLVAAGLSPLASGLALARVEIALHWHDAQALHVDAADAVLDARLHLRGEDPAASWPERRAWRALARERGWRTVDTSGDRATTLATLLAEVRL